MMVLQQNSASWRDPRGSVFHLQDRVLRVVYACAMTDFEFVRSTGFIADLTDTAHLLPETILDLNTLPELPANTACALEHPRLPFISYPYEWSFSALKAATLLHLEIQLAALNHDVTLTDASAYNIQFQGSAPIFIDHLAFCRYQPGSLWNGYRQFCEQFLNPLLLTAYVKVPFQDWYRGSMVGISPRNLRSVLPFYRKFFPKIFLHVVMQSMFQNVASKDAAREVAKINFSRDKQQRLLRSMQHWISNLKPNTHSISVWQKYSQQHPKSLVKQMMVSDFVQTTKPKLLYDLGCNRGEYVKLALNAGAKWVIGFDGDPAVVDDAYVIAAKEKLNFLPLYTNLINPSPDQGWNQNERMGLLQRGPADALLALALIHHLAIAQNIPLRQIAVWLMTLAPQGLVEFIPKEDENVQELLRLRPDIFADYSQENFIRYLEESAHIVKIVSDPATRRNLIWYQKR